MRSKIRYLQTIKIGDKRMNLFHPSKTAFVYKNKSSAYTKAKKLRKEGFWVRTIKTKVGYQLIGVKRSSRAR